MARKILPIILSFFIIYTPFFAFASTAPSGGGGWNPKSVSRVGLDDIIEATARQQVTRNGSAVTLEAVIRKTVERQAVGKVLLSRILGGGLLVGATQSLIEGIGWVMEEGTYVKYKLPDNMKEEQQWGDWCYYTSINSEQCQNTTSAVSSPEAEASNYGNHWWGPGEIKQTDVSPKPITKDTAWVTYMFEYKITSNNDVKMVMVTGKRVALKSEEPKKERIVLTDKMVGDMAVGDYTDPVDRSKDKKDRKWTGVGEAYQPDPTGIGNELSDELDSDMDNAPETPSKPSKPPETDGEGQKYPTGKDKGTEGTTDQDKDPTTGEPTGSGTFNLPAWCLWAADNCEWHKEDKKHQEDETKVWEDEKKHRGDEKTFWQTVKDWFTWTKDDSDLPDRDDSDLNTTVDFEEKKIGLNVSPQCPAPTFETITLHGVTAQVKTSDYTYICQLDWLIKPFTIGFASVLACFILFGFNRGSDD